MTDPRPRIALFVTWKGLGFYILLYLAALQNVGQEIEEAASVDGAGPVRSFFSVTLPMLKPTLFTVLTLGLIGTWQVFDQVYLIGDGKPAKTTLMPAYLAYTSAFDGLKWGQGAAIAFVVFGIIVAMTLLQRWVLRDRDLGRSGIRRERRFVTTLLRDAGRANTGRVDAVAGSRKEGAR